MGMTGSSRDMKLIALVGADTRWFTREMRGMRKELGGISKEVKSMSRNMTRDMKGVAAATKQVSRGMGNVKQVAGGMILGQTIMNGIARATNAAKSSVIDFNSQLDMARIALIQMLKSEKLAEQVLEDLKKTAAVTPFRFPDLLEGYQRLLAFGLAAKDVKPALMAIGDASAALGKGDEGIQRMTLALGQMMTQGRVLGGELLQLSQVGVNARKYLAQGLKKTPQEITAMMRKGQIEGREGVRLIVEGMTKEFGGQMKKQSGTWMGAVSTIQDAIQIRLAGAFRPFFDMLKSGANAVAQFLMSAKFDEFANNIADGLQRGIEYGRNFIQNFGAMWADISGVLQPGIDGIQKSVSNVGQVFMDLWPIAQSVFQGIAEIVGPVLVPAFNLAGQAVALLTSGISGLTGWLANNKSAVLILVGAVTGAVIAWTAWTAVMKAHAAVTFLVTKAQWLLNTAMAANPIMLVVMAIGALVAGFVMAWKHSETFRKIVSGSFELVTSAIGDAAGFIIQALRLLLMGFLTLADGFVSGAATAFGWLPGIGDKFEKANSDFDHFKDSLLGGMEDLANQMYGWGVKIGTDFGSGITNGVADAQAAFLQSERDFINGGPVNRSPRGRAPIGSPDYSLAPKVPDLGSSALGAAEKSNKVPLKAVTAAQKQALSVLDRTLTLAVRKMEASAEGPMTRAANKISVVLTNAFKNKNNELPKYIENIISHLDMLAEAAQSFRTSYISSFESATNVLEKFADAELNTFTGKDMVKAQVDYIRRSKEFIVNLQRLGKLGLNEGMIKQLAEMGPERGFNLAATLIGPQSKDLINQINANQTALDKIKAQSAAQFENALFGPGKNAIISLIKGMKSQFPAVQKLLNELTRQLPDWKGPIAKDKMLLHSAGQTVIASLVEGMRSKQGEVRAVLGEMTSIIEGAAPSLSADFGWSARSGAIGGLDMTNMGRRGDTINISIEPKGHIVTERDLQRSLREGLVKVDRRNTDSGFRGRRR